MISDVLYDAIEGLDHYLNDRTYDAVYTGELRQRIIALRDEMHALYEELDDSS
jgi:hypothetical protein